MALKQITCSSVENAIPFFSQLQTLILQDSRQPDLAPSTCKLLQNCQNLAHLHISAALPLRVEDRVALLNHCSRCYQDRAIKVSHETRELRYRHYYDCPPPSSTLSCIINHMKFSTEVKDISLYGVPPCDELLRCIAAKYCHSLTAFTCSLVEPLPEMNLLLLVTACTLQSLRIVSEYDFDVYDLPLAVAERGSWMRNLTCLAVSHFEHDDLTVLSRCVSLKKLSFRFHSKSNLVEQLPRLLSLPSLEEFDLDGWAGYNRETKELRVIRDAKFVLSAFSQLPAADEQVGEAVQRLIVECTRLERVVGDVTGPWVQFLDRYADSLTEFTYRYFGERNFDTAIPVLVAERSSASQPLRTSPIISPCSSASSHRPRSWSICWCRAMSSMTKCAAN